MLANTGAEAVENVVKIARFHTRRPGVIAFGCSFHGRTLLGMTLTGKVKPYKDGFGPMATDVYHVPSPYGCRTVRARFESMRARHRLAVSLG